MCVVWFGGAKTEKGERKKDGGGREKEGELGLWERGSLVVLIWGRPEQVEAWPETAWTLASATYREIGRAHV